MKLGIDRKFAMEKIKLGIQKTWLVIHVEGFFLHKVAHNIVILYGCCGVRWSS